jgi:hypothetical protein
VGAPIAATLAAALPRVPGIVHLLEPLIDRERLATCERALAVTAQGLR